MNNSELKAKKWDEIKNKYTHLENYCTINLQGIDDETPYYHPNFVINDDFQVITQGDANNKHIYGFRVVWLSKSIHIEIDEMLLDKVIIGYTTNQKAVELCIDTLGKFRNHIDTLKNYTNDYITNVLIGISINEVTQSFINELKTTKELITFMQSEIK